MAGKKTANPKSKNDAGLFIPAGIFLGLGFGFLIDNVVAGLFIGLGSGFLLSFYYKK